MKTTHSPLHSGPRGSFVSDSLVPLLIGVLFFAAMFALNALFLKL